MSSKKSNQIGQYIKAKRLEKGLTQKDLGELTGMTLQGVSAIERGKNPFPTRRMSAFAKALGCERIALVHLICEDYREQLTGELEADQVAS